MWCYKLQAEHIFVPTIEQQIKNSLSAIRPWGRPTMQTFSRTDPFNFQNPRSTIQLQNSIINLFAVLSHSHVPHSRARKTDTGVAIPVRALLSSQHTSRQQRNSNSFDEYRRTRTGMTVCKSEFSRQIHRPWDTLPEDERGQFKRPSTDLIFDQTTKPQHANWWTWLTSQHD